MNRFISSFIADCDFTTEQYSIAPKESLLGHAHAGLESNRELGFDLGFVTFSDTLTLPVITIENYEQSRERIVQACKGICSGVTSLIADQQVKEFSFIRGAQNVSNNTIGTGITWTAEWDLITLPNGTVINIYGRRVGEGNTIQFSTVVAWK